MAHLTIHVPEEHIDALRRELLHAHGECAGRLRRALDVYVASHERLDDVEGTLVELRDLDEALAQVGWAPGGLPAQVTVSAHAEVLADAVSAILAGQRSGGAASLHELARVVGVSR